MNFVTFIENRYQELTLKNQSNPYSAKTDSEIKALHSILNIYRTLLKWFLMPKCLLEYFCVCLGFCNEPEPVLINKVKADQEKELQAQKDRQAELDQPKSSPVKLCEKRKILQSEDK